MPARTPALLALVAVSLGLAACGGDSGNQLSLGDLATRANAICGQAAAQIKAAGPQPDSYSANPRAATAYLDKIVTISDNTVAQLASLQPDAGAKAKWQAFVSANQQAQVALDNARAKADRNDPSGLQDFDNAVTSLQQQINTTAKAVGAVSCSG